MVELQVIARYRLDSGSVPSVTETLKEFAATVAAVEPGNLAFEVYRSAQHEDEIVLLERYRSREAFADHRESRHFREYILDNVLPQLRERTVELFDADDPAVRKD